MIQKLIVACWAIFWTYWLAMRWFTKPTQEVRQGKWNFLQLRFLVFWAVIGALVFKDNRVWASLMGPTLPILAGYPAAVSAISIILVASGMVIAILARIRLAGNWSHEVAFKKDHELIENGVYGYMRHPIYSGVLLMLLGTALFVGRVGTFALFLVMLWFWRVKSVKEEELLAEHFPDEYPAYKTRVKALIPFVW